MAEKNKILVVRAGSCLHGLNNENSDEDFIGVFIPDKEYYYGMKNVELVDLSTIDKLENGKNSKDAIDKKLYSIKKFVHLCESNNPTIMEILFANKENVVFCNEYGKMLLDNKHLFVSNKAINSFLGYATSQRRKFMVKKETYESLVRAKEYLLSKDEKMYLTELSVTDIEFKKYFRIENHSKDLFYVADISVNRNQMVKKAIGILNDRIGNASSRVDLIKEKGYDYKYTSHFLRLLFELKQICEFKELRFPITDKVIIDMKNGLIPLDETLQLLDKYEDEAKSMVYMIEDMKPKTKQADRLLVEITEKFFRDQDGLSYLEEVDDLVEFLQRTMPIVK